MDLELSGRRALITGSSRGIGRAVAETLAREGCDVVVTARDADLLSEVCATISRDTGRQATSIATDLTDHGAIERVVEAAGDIDILVNNAGAIPPGTLTDVDAATWRQAWDLKVFGFIDLTRVLYRQLATSRGVVINVIGHAADAQPPGYIAGAAGNAALVGFTKAIARQAYGDGVRINGVSPGPVATERNEMLLRDRAAKALGSADRWQELTAQMPYGRAATAGEIADAVAFLASPRSAYTNGAILTINGGA